MRPEIAGIEQTAAICLDQHGVGVVGRMIDQIWRD